MGVAPGEGEAADSVTSFLLKAMDPPHLLSIRNAIGLLQVICYFYILHTRKNMLNIVKYQLRSYGVL